MPLKDVTARKAYAAAQYLLHREERLAKQKAYSENHREEIHAYNVSYHTKHRQEISDKASAWNASHPEKRAKIAAAYRARHHERIRAYRKTYRATHQEEIHAAAIVYASTHAEEKHTYNVNHRKEASARTATWAAANPEKVRNYRYRRRALKANAPLNDFTDAQWQEMLEHYDHRCQYCGRKMQRLTQDHITPLSKGGSHTRANILPACRFCNAKKGSRPPLRPVQPLLL